MGKTNFQYDETGNTYYYVFLTFLGLVLIPSTYYYWPRKEDDGTEKKKSKYVQAAARDSVYASACLEKAARMSKKDPWAKTKRRVVGFFLLVGWIVFAMVIYQIQQFDYEMANFDPYEILGVGLDANPKEIKKKYRELSLKYHPDKPTGDEKTFMMLTKAYNSLTDETARYNYEHYGNPDGPQAMNFGIGLPAWLVDDKNAIWVLGVYTLIFMIGLPTAIYYWWSNSIKFSGEQVLLDTTQLYYYFFHKTPHMMLKRVLLVLAASLEFERGHNSDVVERPTDNAEIPQLMKSIPNLQLNNKEKPLCFGYSVKARALLFAHLSRITLPMKTLHQDRLYVIKKCPMLVHEMVTCISQLILLAHAGRIGRLPSLDTIEYAMKLCPMIVQALWDKQSPLLQLPHIEEDQLKHFHSRRRNIKSLAQLAKMKDEDRKSLLRSLTEEQYKDVIRVLAMVPILDIEITTEVVDDEEQHVVTAGAIITVTVVLNRRTMESEMSSTNGLLDNTAEDAEDQEQDVEDLPDDMVELSAPGATGEDSEGNAGEAAAKDEEAKKKAPVWKKPDKKKKKGGGGGAPNKQKQKAKKKAAEAAAGDQDKAQEKASESKALKASKHRRRTPNEGSGSEGEDGSESESDNEKSPVSGGGSGTTEAAGGQSTVEEEDEEAEWEKFQKKMNKREKVLEGKSRISHSVHCPYFTDDKQEYWWVYIADRKNHALVTPPNTVTSLVDREEVELKFTAPQKPGHYNFTVCVRSDSYLGADMLEDIKLDVQEAREAPTEHPQWEFEDDDDEEGSKDEDSDDEFATDDEFDDDDDANDD